MTWTSPPNSRISSRRSMSRVAFEERATMTTSRKSSSESALNSLEREREQPEAPQASRRAHESPPICAWILQEIEEGLLPKDSTCLTILTYPDYPLKPQRTSLFNTA